MGTDGEGAPVNPRCQLNKDVNITGVNLTRMSTLLTEVTDAVRESKKSAVSTTSPARKRNGLQMSRKGLLMTTEGALNDYGRSCQ